MNNTTIKTEKGLVKKLRAIRDKMNEEMQDMTFDETKAYLNKMKANKTPSKKSQ